MSVYRLGNVLIDSGSSPTAQSLIEALRDNPPHQIILTHQHEDHIGGINPLRKAFGNIPVFVPKAHLAIIEAHEPLADYRAKFWGIAEKPNQLSSYEAGHEFYIGGLTLKTYDTPGHTPGHISLTLEWGDKLFACTGDLYFGSRFIPAFFESATDDLIRSRRLIAGLANKVYMLPTHGKTRADGKEVLLHSALQLENAAEQIIANSDRFRKDDLLSLRKSIFPGADVMGQITKGEVSELAFVRSVVDPVKKLPASSLAHYFET
ncbi:MAG: MBL fold metallo-hydrolase [Myxococcota bacterium]|nr:MBL fold metallo-hydrolase [Myxococcota bacterium]